MRAIGWLAGLFLVLGAASAALADTPSTYCGFQTSAPQFCADNAISMSAVPALNNSVSITFSFQSGQSPTSSGYQFEVVLSKTKILQSAAFSGPMDDPSVLYRQLINVSPGLMQFTAAPISTSFGAPFYIFYRLDFLSDPSSPSSVLYSTPWKIYADGSGTPTSVCAEATCGPEEFSVQVGQSQWFTRVSVDQSEANGDSLVLNGVITPMSVACPNITNFTYNFTGSQNLACYTTANGRKVFLGFSSLQDSLIQQVPSAPSLRTPIGGITSTTGQRIGQLVTGISGANFNTYMAAILDKAASIDNLDDVFADLNIRYANLGSVPLVLGSGSPDGTGIQGRNEGWLYPKLTIDCQLQKVPLMLAGMWKKLLVSLYYDGRDTSNYDSTVFQRDTFAVPVVLKGGVHAFLKSAANGAMYDLANVASSSSADSLVVGMSSLSDTLSDFLRNGLWVGLGNNYSGGEYIGAEVTVDGVVVSDLYVDPSTPVLREDVSSRQNEYETISGTKYDPLYYKNSSDILKIHAGGSKNFYYNSTVLPLPYSPTVDYSSVPGLVNAQITNGELNVGLDTSGKQNESFQGSVDIQNGPDGDEIKLGLNGNVLRGVHYAILGFTENKSENFIEDSKAAIKYYMNYLVSQGEEPHMISAETRLATRNNSNWYLPTLSIVDAAGDTVYDKWGITDSELVDCMDGRPYSAIGLQTNCGTPTYLTPQQIISGVSYFGHGMEYDGNLGIGMTDVQGGKINDLEYASEDFSPVPDTSLFLSNSNFVAYACVTGYDFGDGSFISRISKRWRINAMGDSSNINLACLDKTTFLSNCSKEGLKYFNPTDKNGTSSAFVSKIEYDFHNSGKVGALLTDPSVWRHVDFNVCEPSVGGANCNLSKTRISPVFFDVSEVEQ